MEQNEKVDFTLKLDPAYAETARLKRENQALFDSVYLLVKMLDLSMVKHAKWQKISPAGIYECSRCHKDVMTDDIECYSYCHHCGAKMGAKEDPTAAGTVSQWIPCSERLPEKTGHYLCSFKKPNRIDNIFVDLAYWTGGRWYGYLANEINAWMPLPDRYEEEEEKE